MGFNVHFWIIECRGAPDTVLAFGRHLRIEPEEHAEAKKAPEAGHVGDEVNLLTEQSDSRIQH